MSIIGDRANEINLGSCLTRNHINDFYYDYYDIQSIQLILDAGYQGNKSMIGDELKGEWYQDTISASDGLGVDIFIIIKSIFIIIMLTIFIVQKHFHWLIILILFAVCNGDHIICNVANQCSSPIICNQGEDCMVSCIAEKSCISARIICPSGPYNCSLKCSGSGSCISVYINATYGGNLFVNGMNGGVHLSGADIYCPINGECNVRCSSNATSIQGCRSIFIQGNQAKSVHLDAGYGGLRILQWSEIYCPETGGECTIIVHNSGEQKQMNNIEIMAPDSFNQLSIICEEDDPANCYELGQEPKLNCTLEYNHSCPLEMVSPSEWQCMNGTDDFCDTYSLPTTANPTTANPTTANPTTSDPTTANPTTAAPTTEISQCFIGSPCRYTEECCPDDIDEWENGVLCRINKRKTNKYCCIKRGFSGCSIGMDCCIGKRCLDGVCVDNTNSDSSDDLVEEDNVLINDEQKSDLSLNQLNDNNTNVKWILFSVLFIFLILFISCYLCMINIFKKPISKQINTEGKSCGDNKNDNNKENTI